MKGNFWLAYFQFSTFTSFDPFSSIIKTELLTEACQREKKKARVVRSHLIFFDLIYRPIGLLVDLVSIDSILEFFFVILFGSSFLVRLVHD